MDINDFFKNKLIKPKEKTEILTNAVLDSSLQLDFLLEFIKTAKDPVKATCIEAVGHASAKQADIMSKAFLEYAIESLASKAARVKWESAELIVNTIHLFPELIEKAVKGLIQNTDDSGTVVRWSAAQGLSTILLLKTDINKDILPLVQALAQNEEKPSIKKIYDKALKALNK